MRPSFPPPPGGGGRAHLCETEAGRGAGWRDHLSGDLRGPGSPPLPAATPPLQGRGATSCAEVE